MNFGSFSFFVRETADRWMVHGESICLSVLVCRHSLSWFRGWLLPVADVRKGAGRYLSFGELVAGTCDTIVGLSELATYRSSVLL